MEKNSRENFTILSISMRVSLGTDCLKGRGKSTISIRGLLIRGILEVGSFMERAWLVSRTSINIKGSLKRGIIMERG